MKQRVLIAGCGYVGAAAADLFHQAGWQVEGWTHTAESATQFREKPYLARPVDISDRVAVRATGGDFNVVVHCASSRGGGVESYRQVYLEGTRNLIEELRPGEFIFTSSTSVYAQTSGEWVDEGSAAKPTTATGQVLREAEEFVRQQGGKVARLAGIYGPGRSALLRKFLAGEARLEGAGERFLNQVHREDAAAALFLLATSSADGIFNVADNEPITQRAAYEWLAASLQKPLPPASGEPIPRKRGSSNKRVSNRKLRTLGWSPWFPNFAAGMANSVLPSAGARD